ncbi:hypothetical protein U9M48_038511 [Paspalum notatum var. saurae]|uniref:BHLH domain-containing protein n=1 Tax=Paspalum notatum var. saurae TaxID=547442 RepID=A0AAQ3ULZ5_PASNO
MALEAEGFFGCWPPMAAAGGGGWSWGHGGGAVEGMVVGLDGGSAAAAAFWDVGVGADSSSSVMMLGAAEDPAGSPAAPLPLPENGGGIAAAASTDFAQEGAAAAAAEVMPSPLPAARRKRRRSRSVKNKEEVESQRMTHIAVERNRRKQMNEYLAVLRSLMPPSYVQRGDQASIIGGAINYVKEMEQLLQSLEARKHARHDDHLQPPSPGAPPFAGFFTFPQYAMSAGARSPAAANTPPRAADDGDGGVKRFDATTGNEDSATAPASGSRPSGVADVEVTMVESHANLKVLSRRRPRQLLRLVAGLQAHRLTVLHLNVTSAGRMGLYSLSLKVEDDCSLASVDDIAAAVHRIVEAIEQEEEQEQERERSK